MQKVITVESALSFLTGEDKVREIEHPQLKEYLEDDWFVKHITKLIGSTNSFYSITFVLEKGEQIDDFGDKITTD